MISYYENGHTAPPLDALMVIAHMTEKPVAWFLEDPPEDEILNVLIGTLADLEPGWEIQRVSGVNVVLLQSQVQEIARAVPRDFAGPVLRLLRSGRYTLTPLVRVGDTLPPVSTESTMTPEEAADMIFGPRPIKPVAHFPPAANLPNLARTLDAIKNAEAELLAVQAELELVQKGAPPLEFSEGVVDSLLELLRQHRAESPGPAPTKPVEETDGALIRRMRERLAVSRESLADILNWPLNQLEAIERRGEPRHLVNAVAERLGLSINPKGHLVWSPPPWANHVEVATWCSICELARLADPDYSCELHRGQPAPKKRRAKKAQQFRDAAKLPQHPPPASYVQQASELLEAAQKSGEVSESLKTALAAALWHQDQAEVWGTKPNE